MNHSQENKVKRIVRFNFFIIVWLEQRNKNMERMKKANKEKNTKLHSPSNDRRIDQLMNWMNKLYWNTTMAKFGEPDGLEYRHSLKGIALPTELGPNTDFLILIFNIWQW